MIEQRIFAIEGDRADCSFDRVGADLDAAVVEEAGQTLPARERVADRLPPPWAYASSVWASSGCRCKVPTLGASPSLKKMRLAV